ncbi:MAG: hypothetical protein ABR902_16070, partial [Candidatus Korobacteraceae bacterium]
LDVGSDSGSRGGIVARDAEHNRWYAHGRTLSQTAVSRYLAGSAAGPMVRHLEREQAKPLRIFGTQGMPT